MSKNKKMLLCVSVVFLVSTIIGVFLNMLTGANEIYTFAWKRLFPSSAMAAYALFLYSRDFIDSAHQMGTRKLITAAAIGGSLMVGLNLLFGLLRARIGGDLLTQNQESLNATAATLPVAILCADRGRDRIPLYFARMAARADQTGWSADFCDNRRNVICLVAYRYPCRFNPIPSCRSFVGSYL